MKPAFYTILIAQFLSALADNALLFAAIALLLEQNAPQWHTPLLQQFFVISYILLAPFVGSIADAFPKGQVMFVANSIKVIGSTAMMFGLQPLYAYGIVGIGAAAYSPAKYGILTELLAPELLVKANGWMEGSTVTAIILGSILGGQLSQEPHLAIIIITGLYFAAAIFNHFIPRMPVEQTLLHKNPWFMIKDFMHAFTTLWKDPQGQVSLAVTTLFWGAGATLRLVVLAWAAIAIHFNIEQSTKLIAVVAVGIALGSILAARFVQLQHSAKVLPAGILMGFFVIAMIFVQDWKIAACLLFLIGMLSGFFVVPLNALLQHRGHLLIGPGHSIAVQNFNEHIGILLMLGIYAFMVKTGLHMNYIILAFGLFVSISMSIIYKIYRLRIEANLI